jgi:8-oxo-dGTP pyrophosphatase MutT (NUDIX family)
MNLSAGIAVVHLRLSVWRFLLLRAYRNWDFPKGMVTAGESPLDAAVREVKEETGLTGLAFDWGEEHIDTGPYARGKIARYYIARALNMDVVLPVSSELGRPEHHEHRWMDRDTALRITGPRVRDVVTWAASIIQHGVAR